MALSGTNAFNLDVDEVIQEAFERCGLHARSGYDLKSARRSLNLLLAEWANRGINLWTVELRTQTLTASTTSYTLDSDLIDILEAVVYKASDTTTDMEVDRISRAEYLNISKKSTEAVPTQYYLLRFRKCKDVQKVYGFLQKQSNFLISKYVLNSTFEFVIAIFKKYFQNIKLKI